MRGLTDDTELHGFHRSNIRDEELGAYAYLETQNRQNNKPNDRMWTMTSTITFLCAFHFAFFVAIEWLNHMASFVYTSALVDPALLAIVVSLNNYLSLSLLS